jgi:hypothetical protein
MFKFNAMKDCSIGVTLLFPPAQAAPLKAAALPRFRLQEEIQPSHEIVPIQVAVFLTFYLFVKVCCTSVYIGLGCQLKRIMNDQGEERIKLHLYG